MSCILGMDFMSRARVIIDTQKQKIRMEDVPHFPAEDNPILTNKMTDIVLGKDHTVPPLSESKVSCTVASPFEHGLILPIEQGPCYIMDRVVKLISKKEQIEKECCAIILNSTHEPLHLTKNTVIGTFEGLENQSFRPIENVLQINKDSKVQLTDVSHLSQVKLDHLPMSVKGKYQALVNEYPDVFSRHDLDVGHCRTLPHTVLLTDHTKIVSVNQYRLPYHLKEVAIDYVEKLLKSGVVRPSTSVFNSPLMLVKKPNADPKKPLGEQYRLVHNYIELNKLIAPCSYPLRHLYELMDEVASGKNIFSAGP